VLFVLPALLLLLLLLLGAPCGGGEGVEGETGCGWVYAVEFEAEEGSGEREDLGRGLRVLLVG